MNERRNDRFVRWLTRWQVPLLVAALVVIVVTGVAVIGLAVVQGVGVTPTPSGPSVHLVPKEGEPGVTILVSGTGWEPGDIVTVHLQALADPMAMSSTS